MAKRDEITGKWRADGNTGDFLISFPGKKVNGFYSYQSLGRKNSRAYFAEDANSDGRYDSTVDPTIGTFLAKSSFIVNSLPVVSSGRFVADEDSGRFSIFYGSTKFATGLIFYPRDFF